MSLKYNFKLAGKSKLLFHIKDNNGVCYHLITETVIVNKFACLVLDYLNCSLDCYNLYFMKILYQSKAYLQDIKTISTLVIFYFITMI